MNLVYYPQPHAETISSKTDIREELFFYLKRLKLAVICISFFAIFVGLHATPALSKDAVFEISFSVDKEIATIGDEIILTIDVLHSSDFELSDISKKINVDPFELKRVNRLPAKTGNNATSEAFELVLTTFVIGDLHIPKIAISFTKPDGEKGRVYTDVLPLKVVSVRSSDDSNADIRNLKSQKGLPLDPKERHLIWFAAFGLLLVVLTFVLMKYGPKWLADWKRRRMSPYERALADLESLNNTPDQDPIQIRMYYSKISNIIRSYLYEQFKFGSIEWTSLDYKQRLPQSNLLDEAQENILNIFKKIDLVKFAKMTPDIDQSKSTLKMAKDVVIQTKSHFDQVNQDARGNRVLNYTAGGGL